MCNYWPLQNYQLPWVRLSHLGCWPNNQKKPNESPKKIHRKSQKDPPESLGFLLKSGILIWDLFFPQKKPSPMDVLFYFLCKKKESHPQKMGLEVGFGKIFL